jgi:hypothetical protein
MAPDHVRKRRSGVFECLGFLKGFLKAPEGVGTPQGEIFRKRRFFEEASGDQAAAGRV